MVDLIIKHFEADSYTALFNPQNGFFARIEDNCGSEIEWAQHGPELIDISITNKCSRECQICYKKSSTDGRHIAVKDFRHILEQARLMHVFQVALGGGNPNQHPDFEELLRMSKIDFGIVPNYTTNGWGLNQSTIMASRKYCGAVAVSAYYPYTQTEYAVSLLSENEIRTNVHYVLTSSSIETAIDWLNNPPSWLLKANALIFLNYKPIGRCADLELLANKNKNLSSFFNIATSREFPFSIGFDSCSVTGIARTSRVPSESLEGCDAGRFSLYISEELDVMPCSFMQLLDIDKPSLRFDSLLDIWQKHPLFTTTRSQLSKYTCSNCYATGICRCVCPIFPSISLCDRELDKAIATI